MSGLAECFLRGTKSRASNPFPASITGYSRPLVCLPAHPSHGLQLTSLPKEGLLHELSISSDCLLATCSCGSLPT